MKMNDIREMTEEELVKSLEDNRQELLHLNIQKQTGQLENSAMISGVRKDIARKLTEISARKKQG